MTVRLDEEVQALVGNMFAADDMCCGECVPRNRIHIDPYGVKLASRRRGIDVSPPSQCPIEVLPDQEISVPGGHLTQEFHACGVDVSLRRTISSGCHRLSHDLTSS
jgi:hypothetical protein